MSSQTIDSTLWKFLAACLAGMLIAITRILELLTSFEEFEDQLIGFAAHFSVALRFRLVKKAFSDARLSYLLGKQQNSQREVMKILLFW